MPNPQQEVAFKATAALQMHGAPEYCWCIFNPTQLHSHHFLTHAVTSLIEAAGLLGALPLICSQCLASANVPVFMAIMQRNKSKMNLANINKKMFKLVCIKFYLEPTERLRTLLMHNTVHHRMNCVCVRGFGHKNCNLRSIFLLTVFA